jgi:hypothetical protein
VARARLVVVFSSLCVSLAPGASLAAAPAARQAPVDPPAAALADFKTRVDAYLELRDALARRIPDVTKTGDPARISAREKALGQAIARARASARAGDVFGPLMTPHLLRVLEDDWKSRNAADRRAIFEDIPPGLTLRVNQPYPTTIPLVIAPPGLLAQLPVIPDALEYRLLERRLLLRDRDANLIIDVLVGTPPKRVQ